MLQPKARSLQHELFKKGQKTDGNGKDRHNQVSKTYVWPLAYGRCSDPLINQRDANERTTERPFLLHQTVKVRKYGNSVSVRLWEPVPHPTPRPRCWYSLPAVTCWTAIWTASSVDHSVRQPLTYTKQVTQPRHRPICLKSKWF